LLKDEFSGAVFETNAVIPNLLLGCYPPKKAKRPPYRPIGHIEEATNLLHIPVYFGNN
jgi:hypothetical protein